MAATKMKIKKDKSGGHVVMVLVKHPMETGNRKDKKTGKRYRRILLRQWYSRTMELRWRKRT